MFAIDTNILIYAHNIHSPFHEKATNFIEGILDERKNDFCIPSQVVSEFINVITRNTLQSPSSLKEAIEIIRNYLDFGVTVINPKETQTQTFLDILSGVKTRKKIFDVVLASSLKDNNIEEFYTVNVKDFEEFNFLRIINPLE